VLHNRAATVDPVHENGLFHFFRHSIGRVLVVLALALTFAGGSIAPALAQQTPSATPAASPVVIDDPLSAAVGWLVAQQDPSGGFLGFNGTPDAGTTIDAVMALLTVPGIDQTVIDSAVAFLNDNAADYAGTGAGQAAKVVLFQAATGGDVTSIDGINPLEIVQDGVNPDTGLFGIGIYDEAIGVLALVAAGQPVPPEWIDTLRAKQIANGGWAFDGTTEEAKADSNTTAIVIQALVAAGVANDDPAIVNGLAYLKTVVAPTGGFAYAAADPLLADANSTGIVIQALAAVGQDASAAGEWGDPAPAQALANFQNPSGAFRYMDSVPDDNLFATIQAVIALTGVPFPVPPAS
jgi:hypothetical protein